MTYYAVHTGHNPGIYMTWDAAKKQVDGYPGAIYRGFKNIKDAENFTLHGDAPEKPKVASVQEVINLTVPDILSKYKQHSDYRHDDTVVHIYTDGSTIGNGTKHATGGYGVFIPGKDYVKERLIVRKLVHGKITNGVAELKAIITALDEIVKDQVNTSLEFIIHYDSTYAADVITGKKAAKANLDLVNKGKELLALCTRVKFEHVYSHTGKQDLHSLGNEIADKLAGLN